jgi:hypothetical protein
LPSQSILDQAGTVERLGIGPALERPGDRTQPAGIHEVVVVQIGDDLAPRCFERQVASAGLALAAGAHHSQARVIDRGEELSRAIRAAVVDDHQFERAVALCENGGDRALQIGAPVAARNQHRYQRRRLAWRGFQPAGYRPHLDARASATRSSTSRGGGAPAWSTGEGSTGMLLSDETAATVAVCQRLRSRNWALWATLRSASPCSIDLSQAVCPSKPARTALRSPGNSKRRTIPPAADLRRAARALSLARWLSNMPAPIKIDASFRPGRPGP